MWYRLFISGCFINHYESTIVNLYRYRKIRGYQIQVISNLPSTGSDSSQLSLPFFFDFFLSFFSISTDNHYICWFKIPSCHKLDLYWIIIFLTKFETVPETRDISYLPSAGSESSQVSLPFFFDAFFPTFSTSVDDHYICQVCQKPQRLYRYRFDEWR